MPKRTTITLVLVATLIVSVAIVVATEYLYPSRIIDLKVDKVRYGDLRALETAVEMYRQKFSRLPSESKGLSELTTPRGGSDTPIIDELRSDPWGGKYVYRTTIEVPGYKIYSLGKDGIDQSGAGDDIISSQKKYSCEEYGVGCINIPADIELVASLFALLSSLALVARAAIALSKGRHNKAFKADAPKGARP